MSVRKFTIADAPFERAPEQDGDVFLGDVIDRKDGGSISVRFARYPPNQMNDYMVTYDEALIITRARFSVRSAGGEVTAEPGEVIYLPRDTAVTYVAYKDGAELVYVTHPHWKTA